MASMHSCTSICSELHMYVYLVKQNIYRVGCWQDCQVDVAKASFDVRQPDKELWKKVCRGFLKGRLPSQQQQQQAVAL